jgi:hypothetical protein
MRELIQVQHPDVSGTAWAPRSALGQMDPGWSAVPDSQTVTEPASDVPADPEPTKESETD